MKNIFRHYSTILLMLGVAVSFIAFMNGMTIYRQIQNALAEVNEYQYKYTYSISISEIPDMDDLLSQLSNISGNLLLSDDDVYLDGDRSYHSAEILLKQDEDLPYPVDVINEDGTVIVGKELYAKLCSLQDGVAYLSINGTSASVYGIASGENSSLLDYTLIIKPNTNQLQELVSEKNYLALTCGSHSSVIEQEIQTFYENNYDACNIYYEQITNKYIDVGSENNDESFYIIIAIFAAINCISISEFWIMRRKKEMIIRKLCGFSNLRLFRLLYTQILWICGCSVVVVCIGQWLVSVISQNDSLFSLDRLLLSLAFLLIMALIIVAVPTYKAAHYKINKGEI